MRIRILSDLHLEFGPVPLTQGAEDLVVLAGDIDNGTRGIAWAEGTFSVPVLYVCGNHEYYGGHFDEIVPALRAAAKGTRVVVLEDEALVLNGVRFVGATLWTDLALYGDVSRAAHSVERVLSDYRVIKATDPGVGVARGKRLLRAEDTATRFAQSRAAFKEILECPFAGKTVVVSHHLPSARSISPRWRDDPVNCGFASNLEPFIARFRPALWIHGHTHDSFDYLIEHGDGSEATRIVCNPAGYPTRFGRENRAFDPDFAVEI